MSSEASDNLEELTADIFKEHGYSVILTPPIKDKGADIIVFSNDITGAKAIVECKKYAKGRKVGVSLVRQLVGAAVWWEVKRAYLVTTSDFSSDALSTSYDYVERGYEINHVNASELFSMLQVYNTKLPPLHKLTKRRRREIIRQNRN